MSDQAEAMVNIKDILFLRKSQVFLAMYFGIASGIYFDNAKKRKPKIGAHLASHRKQQVLKNLAA